MIPMLSRSSLLSLRWNNRVFFVPIFLIWFFSTPLSYGQTLSKTYPKKVSIGAFVNQVKGPIFYDSFIPLIYEYQVPVYKALDITLRDWRSKCESDAYTPSYTCPVFFHYEKFLERFENEVVPKAWFDPVTNISTAPSPMMDVDLDEFCNKIQRHFRGSLTQEFGFEEYIEKLKECIQGRGGALPIDRQIPDYVYNIKAMFKKINDNYENEFSSKFIGEVNKKIGPAYYVNAVTAHQNALLIAYLLEKTRWDSAKSSCREQRVPETLLRTRNVTKHLIGLNERLETQNLQTAVNAGEISTIFKLPLTDCSFIDRTGHFVVRVLIPVTRKDASPKLFRLSTTPFFIEGKMCQLNLERDAFFLHDENTNSYQHTECNGNTPLCHVKGFKDSITDLCLMAVFTMDHLAAKRYCEDNFECVEIQKENARMLKFPMVQRTYSDAWVISGTGTSGDKLSIKCEGSTEEIKVNLTKNLSGALEVRLPCRCYILFNSEQLHPTKPCSAEYSKTPEIYQILLPQFLQDNVLSNKNSNLSISLQSFDSKFLQTDQNEKEHAPQTQGHEHDTKVVPISENTSSGAQLGALWTLVILQLFLICFILIFGLYKYTQYRKEMSYSKERLVYNIYASPSDSNIPESSSKSTYKVTTTGTGNINHF